MDALVLAVTALAVLSVIVMTRASSRESSPWWWLWPWGRLHWAVLVILGAIFVLMMTLY